MQDNEMEYVDQNDAQGEIEELELTIEAAKEMVKFGDALQRLEENKDFKTVFTDGYFREEAIRLTHASADMTLTTDQKNNLMVAIQGISILKQFLNNNKTMSMAAKNAMAEAEEEIEAIRAEQNEDYDEGDV